MDLFGGKVLFLDRSDINTDEIIPAKYLTEISKEALKPYLLEDLSLKGFDPTKDTGQAGYCNPGQFRMRFIARACPLGPGGKRHPHGDCRKLCTYFPAEHV